MSDQFGTPLSTIEIIEYLNKLDRLFSTPATWTTEWGARCNDLPINPCNPHAQCWCLMGGLWLLTNDPNMQEHYRAYLSVEQAIRKTMRAIGFVNVTMGEYNDDHGYDAVKSLIALTLTHVRARDRIR